MSIPDADVFPHATGEAAKFVSAHSAPSDLVLYGSWFCPYVQVVSIALLEKNVPFQWKEINPYNKTPEFLSVSKKGLVPAVQSDGKNLIESGIITEFLEDKFANDTQYRKLLPTNPEERALVRIQKDFITKKIHPAFFKTIQSQDAEDQKKNRSELVKALKEFSDEIDTSKGPFYGGKQLNAVDVALAPWATRSWVIEENRGGPLTKEEVGETYLKWAEAIRAAPSVISTTSDKEKLVPLYNRYLRNEAQSEAAKAIRAGGVIP
ncbi:unnamed protein product [Sympodiomycopsis kandeliae]